nr:hypothetical protein [Tanacetum cinerariifolium]
MENGEGWKSAGETFGGVIWKCDWRLVITRLNVDGLSWAVRLGRRGSTDSNATQAVEDLPRGNDNPTQLIASFDK